MGAVDPQMLAIGALLSLGAIAYSIKEANDPKNKNKGNEKVGPKQKYIQVIKKQNELDDKYKDFRKLLEQDEPNTKEINKALAAIKDKKEKEEIITHLQSCYQLDLTAQQAKVMRPLTKDEKKERITADMQMQEEISDIPIAPLFRCFEFFVFFYGFFFFMQLYGVTTMELIPQHHIEWGRENLFGSGNQFDSQNPNFDTNTDSSTMESANIIENEDQFDREKVEQETVNSDL